MLNKNKKESGSVKAGSTYKKIKIITIAALSAILVTIIVIAAFYIPKAIETERARQEAKSRIVRYTYCFAIDYNDRQGIRIPTVWTKDFELKDFRQCNDNPGAAMVDPSGILKAGSLAEKGDQTTITFSLDGKIACVIYVYVVEAEGYISSVADLKNLDNQSGAYIQTEDIMLTESVSIKNFRGKYYGNHRVISGHDVSAGGGLFDTSLGGGFYGIALTNIKGKIENASDGYYGALLNKGEYCKIEYCSAEGGFEAKNVGGIGAVGGIAGYMKGLSRLADEDPYLDHVEACTTNLNIKAEISGGSPRIGGVIGYAENMTISDTTIRGKIEVSVPDALNIVRLYAGGFAGEIKRVYDLAASRITYLDSSYNLVSYADITVSVTGGDELKTVYAGGIFGSVTNLSAGNIFCEGSLSINGGGATVVAGGVAARSENEMRIGDYVGSIRMDIHKCKVTKAISIESSGDVIAGGIAGYAIKTDLDENEAKSPAVTGSREGRQTHISDGIGMTGAA